MERELGRRGAGRSRREPDFVWRLESVLYFQPIARKDRRDRIGNRGLHKRHSRVAEAAAVLSGMLVKRIDGGGLRANDRAQQ
jgi:hypothetical protein